MTTHKICDQAALYVLGALEGDELASYQHHLEQGCSICDAELNDIQSAVDQLSYSALSVAPPPSLRSKLMARVKHEGSPASKNQSIDIQTGLTFVRTTEEPWQEIQPGIELKPLFVDQKQGRMTALARMAPNTIYGAHRHTTAEEFYVLEGTCNLDGQLLQVGDYHRAEAGSVHYETSTKDGCLLLIIFSPDNEMLSERT